MEVDTSITTCPSHKQQKEEEEEEGLSREERTSGQRGEVLRLWVLYHPVLEQPSRHTVPGRGRYGILHTLSAIMNWYSKASTKVN